MAGAGAPRGTGRLSRTQQIRFVSAQGRSAGVGGKKGIVPKNTGGLGDAATAARVFALNEVRPLQQAFLDVNERLGMEVFRFEEYRIE